MKPRAFFYDKQPRLDLCRHQSGLALLQNLKLWHMSTTISHTIHPTNTHSQTHAHTYAHSQTHWSSTSITIIRQIYLHWSRTKIKLPPLSPPTLPGHPRPNPITARYLPWLIGFQSNWISLRWRWEEERLPCSKPLGIGIGRRGRGGGGGKKGMQKRDGKEKRSNWARLSVYEIEEDWRRER